MSLFVNSRCRACRVLCWLMAALMFAAPSLPALAQENARPSSDYLLPQSCVVVSLKPKQVLASPAVQMLPIEVLQAAALQHVGLDPLEIESLQVSVEPPMAGPPNYSVLTVFSPEYRGKLHPQLTAHTQPGQLDGREYLESQHPLMPSYLMLTGNSLLAGPHLTLQKLLAQESSIGDGLLLGRLREATADDLYVAIDLEMLRPLINQLVMQAQTEVPAKLQSFLSAPDLIRLVELRVNVSGTGPVELTVEANSTADASKLIDMFGELVEMWRSQASENSAKLLQSSDPIEQALGRYQDRMMSGMKTALMPQQEDAKIVVFRQVPGDGDNSALTTVAISGILVALLLPAVQAAREAARRNVSMNNLKQIMLALLNYHDTHGQFPPHASYDENDNKLLSWRVHILPYLDQQQLYEQFRLDEPWDSAHNRKLISKMPELYLDPSSRLALEEGKTHYLGVQGEHQVFRGTKEGRKLREITDGLSNTLMVLQANDKSTVLWTKPADWQLDDKNPLHGLTGSMHPGIFGAAYCDGSVRSISEQIDVSAFKHLLTVDGGEVINLDH